VRRQIDLAEAALADEPPERIAAHRLQLVAGEFTAGVGVSAVREGAASPGGVLLEKLLVRVCELPQLSAQGAP
jgi:hypothetical protein